MGARRRGWFLVNDPELPLIDDLPCFLWFCFAILFSVVTATVVFIKIATDPPPPTTPPLYHRSASVRLQKPRPPDKLPNTRKGLDDALRDAAFRALVHPRTGVPYTASPPSALRGVTISVVRLRSGSLARHGFRHFEEFDIPPGVFESRSHNRTPQTSPLRLALVYQDLGKWSARYYTIPGHVLLSNVLGLHAYDAMNIPPVKPPREIGVRAFSKPISIKFRKVSAVTSGAKCVHLHSNGSYRIESLLPGNLCRTATPGHFSIAAPAKHTPPPPKHRGASPTQAPVLAPAPAPVPSPGGAGEVQHRRKWKVAVFAVAGVAGLALLVLWLFWSRKLGREEKMEGMIRRADNAEVLRLQRVGSAYLPAGGMIRTQPVIENDYVP